MEQVYYKEFGNCDVQFLVRVILQNVNQATAGRISAQCHGLGKAVLTEAACKDYLFRLRWANRFVCPRCQTGNIAPKVRSTACKTKLSGGLFFRGNGLEWACCMMPGQSSRMDVYFRDMVERWVMERLGIACYGAWRSLASVPALGAGSRRFKSSRPELT